MKKLLLHSISLFCVFLPIQSWGATSPTLTPQGMDVYSAPAPLTPQAPTGIPAQGTATTLTPPTSTATQLMPPPSSPSATPFMTPPQPTIQERNLPLPTIPAPKPAVKAPSPPTAEQIEEARRKEAARKAQEEQRKKEHEAAMENARKEDMHNKADELYAQGQHKKAFEIWEALAKENHAASMTALGLSYDRGEGVYLNSKEAVAWFRKAAEAKDVDGMYHLGRMLVQGRGGAQHLDTAATWLKKAAELEQHDAQYLLAVLYERGEGVLQNDTEAAAWYSLAASGLNIDAQARLGHLYRIGKGVPKNNERATLLLYGATMAGHKRAQQELFAMGHELYGDAGFPKVTLFGVEIGSKEGLTRATMRSALSVAKVKSLREDANFICDTYNLIGSVPGAHQMAICYGVPAIQPEKEQSLLQAQQEVGFLKIDYEAKNVATANAVQSMVEQRFGKPTAGEQGLGFLWNLGNVIVATQYVPQKEEVGLMYIIPRVYHTTQGGK